MVGFWEIGNGGGGGITSVVLEMGGTKLGGFFRWAGILRVVSQSPGNSSVGSGSIVYFVKEGKVCSLKEALRLSD